MSVVSLSASMRNNLLALQNTASLVSQTQGRLSTGLRIAAAVDDPVAYFQSKSLLDRASDLGIRKDQINQGVSTVTAASDGLQGVTDIIKQLQGLIISVRSTTSAATVSNLVDQFNMLRQQIDSLTQDASYQGINLINGKGQALEVSFSDASSSYLHVQSLDARAQSIGVDAVRNIRNQFVTTVPPVGLLSGRVAFDYDGSVTGTALQDGQTLQFTLAMTANVFISSSPGLVRFSYGSLTLSIAAGGGSGPAPSPFAGIVSASLGDVALAGSPLGIAGAATNEAGKNPALYGGLPATVYYGCYLNPTTSTNNAIRAAALGIGFTAAQADQIVNAASTAADASWGPGTFSMRVYNAVTAAIGPPTSVSSALSVVRTTTLNTAVAGGYTAEEAKIIADAAYTAASHGTDRLTGTVNEQVATIVAKAAAASVAGAATVAAQRKAEEISGISAGGGGPTAGGITGMLTDGMVLIFDVTAMAGSTDPTGSQIKVEGLTDPDQTVVMKPFDGQLTLGAGMLRTASLAQKQLDSALIQVRSATQTLGTHIALLQIRLDFSVAYIGSLVTGANTLTLADINEESARMLALQTRQTLGIQAMSLSTGQGILQLFR